MKTFKEFLLESVKRTFTTDQAKKIGDKLNVNWDKVDIEEFRMGLEVEMEHNQEDDLDVVHSDEQLAKIALAHLKELDDYYTKLKQMEES